MGQHDVLTGPGFARGSGRPGWMPGEDPLSWRRAVKRIERGFGFAGLMLAALAGCGGGGASDEGREVAETREERATGVDPAGLECPAQEDISAAIGATVERQSYQGQCFYQDAEYENSVGIMRIGSGSAGQMDQELAESAQERGTTLDPVDVGDRAAVWTLGHMGQGYAVKGAYGVLVTLEASASSADPRDGLVKILEMAVE